MAPLDLPADFLNRLREIIAPDDWPAVGESFAAHRRPAFRVNTLKATPSDVLKDLAATGVTTQPVVWSKTAFTVPRELRQALTHSNEADSGDLYVQSLSSQLAAILLEPQPGEMILDLAAAPGGKTSHLAALMQNQGWLSAVEPIRDRFFRLQANLKRLGVTIAHYYQIDGRLVSKKTGPRFDRILLDAPCSAESRFRNGDPDTHQFWSERKIRESARKQAGLIRSAFGALKPGGRLLYCTCTFAPEENEAIVAGLLDENPESARLIPLPDWIPSARPGLSGFRDEEFPTEMRLVKRILPSEEYDAFFYALLEKGT